MTTSEVDQELERLFAVARDATQPDAGARERIRTGVAAQLTAGGGAAGRAWGWRAWWGVGVGILGVCAIALGVRGMAPRESASPLTPVRLAPTSSAPASASAPPAEGLAATPSSAPEPPPAVVAPASASASSKRAPAAASSAPAARSAETTPDPAEELALVRSMQQALRSGNPGQALTLAAEHARRFPHGTLVEEREGVRAVGQCQLVVPAARAPILEAFVQRFANSPYAARVKAACQ
ncbi:MAG TPA: hypothetical protein VHB79_05560 [Polyangiaceae bacterium]|nr:hypothetical protein [Polyangiaceae bacterium]